MAARSIVLEQLKSQKDKSQAHERGVMHRNKDYLVRMETYKSSLWLSASKTQDDLRNADNL